MGQGSDMVKSIHNTIIFDAEGIESYLSHTYSIVASNDSWSEVSVLYLGQEVFVEWVLFAGVKDFIDPLNITWSSKDQHWTVDFIFLIEMRVNHRGARVETFGSYKGSSSKDFGLHLRNLTLA